MASPHPWYVFFGTEAGAAGSSPEVTDTRAYEEFCGRFCNGHKLHHRPQGEFEEDRTSRYLCSYFLLRHGPRFAPELWPLEDLKEFGTALKVTKDSNSSPTKKRGFDNKESEQEPEQEQERKQEVVIRPTDELVLYVVDRRSRRRIKVQLCALYTVSKLVDLARQGFGYHDNIDDLCNIVFFGTTLEPWTLLARVGALVNGRHVFLSWSNGGGQQTTATTVLVRDVDTDKEVAVTLPEGHEALVAKLTVEVMDAFKKFQPCRLIFAGRLLEQNCTIGSYNIGDGYTVHLKWTVATSAKDIGKETNVWLVEDPQEEEMEYSSSDVEDKEDDDDDKEDDEDDKEEDSSSDSVSVYLPEKWGGPDKWSIFVKRINGETERVCIGHSTTASDVLERLGLGCNAYRLIWAGQQLEPNLPLVSCGVKEDTTVHVVSGIRGC